MTLMMLMTKPVLLMTCYKKGIDRGVLLMTLMTLMTKPVLLMTLMPLMTNPHC